MSLSLEDYADDEGSSVVVATAFPNGYGYRRVMRIGGTALGGGVALTDLPLRFDETRVSLKSVANGGRVQSASGWDIRFEDISGNQLKHELETYDPAAGHAACWVRLTSVTPGFDQDIFVYYGKPGLAGPEQDVSATGTWARCLGCWRMPDGRDVTGHGRDMTTSGVTSGAIGGHPAAVLTASSYLELLDVSFMNAKSALTAFLLVQPSSLPAESDFVRFGGTATGSGQLAFTFYNEADIANALRNYVALGGTNSFVISPANSVVAGHVSTWACAEQSGAWPVQYLDGVPVTSTQRGAIGTGTTSYPSTTLLRIGAGYGDFTTCIPGAYGRFWVFDSRVPDAFLAFLDLTIRYPRACYGIGDEDAWTDTDRSPVMAPVQASVGAGGTVDVAVLAHAADLDGTAMTAGTESPSAALGSTSIVANNVRYIAGSVQGTDRVGVTATAGAKAAHALMTVAVGPGSVGGGGGGNLPLTPNYTGYFKLYRKTAGNSTATQHTGDVELKGGTVGDGQQAVALVTIDRPDHTSQGMFNPPYTLEFDYTPLDNNTDNAGVFSQLALLRHTGGSSANLSSIDSNLTPQDVGWGPAGVTGIRFSFDTKEPAADRADKMRGRANDTNFGAGSNYVSANFALATGGTPQNFVFPRNQASHLAWSFPGDDTISVTATIPGVGAVSQSWQDPLISTYLGTAAMNIVLQSYAGRDALFSNVVWTDGGRGGGTGAEGVTPAFPDVAARIAGGGYYKNTTAANLQADFDALTPSQIASGAMLLVNYGSVQSVTGGLTLGKSGTAGKPIVIRIGGWNATTSTFTEPNGSNATGGTGFFPDSTHRTATASWTGRCQITGSHVWIRGLRFQGGGQTDGDGNRFNRCFFDSDNGQCDDSGVGNIWDWCEWTEALGGLFYQHPKDGCRNAWVYRGHFHDNGNSHQGKSDGCVMMTGTGTHDQFTPTGVEIVAAPVIQDCLFTNQKFFGNNLEIKCTGAKILRCSFSQGSGDSNPKPLVRHGNNSQWRACHFGDASLAIRGKGHIIADCTASSSASRGPAGGDMTATDWIAYVSSHISASQDGKPTTNYQTGEDVVFAGTNFALLLGYRPAAGTIPPPRTIVENDCTGAINKDSGCSPLASYTTRARSVSQYVEATTGLVKAPKLWTGGVDVGPNATYSSAQ